MTDDELIEVLRNFTFWSGDDLSNSELACNVHACRWVKYDVSGDDVGSSARAALDHWTERHV